MEKLFTKDCGITAGRVRVIKTFKARWVNVGYKDGKMVDVVREEEYKDGELLFLCEWRPEGIHAQRCETSEVPMFVFWKYLEGNVVICD